ncbi:MAG: class I SAM-dependent methyltransferase [Deltaproteobacteria bacterium]|nr:class I SAM-dependent methyltransferase [Deltaproteobacteria bacterium]
MGAISKLFSYFSKTPSRAAESPACHAGAPFWYLDSPDITSSAPSDPLLVKGWIASLTPVKSIYFSKDEPISELSITRHPRPDVEKVYGVAAVGFEAPCPLAMISGSFVTLNFENGNGTFEIIVPVPRGAPDKSRAKSEKLKKISDILHCPSCATDLQQRSSALQCSKCGENYPADDRAYNFLTPALREEFKIVPTDNVSANSYDGTALNLIHRHLDGLILDCGAGLREKYYHNVVNFEIVPYDTTDVIGVGERLPFKDNSFDAVLSFAVLEHVKDPFACAKELCRVLKPGAPLYCQVPFLQPLHGYPHHYYNMTQQGLENLFEGSLDKVASGPINFGQPIFSLSWFLGSYCAALPKREQERFKNMRVSELLAPGSAYLGAEFVTSVSSEGKKELSCCNYLIGIKPERINR